MGNFTIHIEAIGGHGVNRKVKNGHVVDFKVEHNSPDAMAKALVDELISRGVQINSATLTHWPGAENEVSDDLITGIRTGQFEEANQVQ